MEKLARIGKMPMPAWAKAAERESAKHVCFACRLKKKEADLNLLPITWSDVT